MSAKLFAVALVTGAGVIGGAMMGCYCYCKSKEDTSFKPTNNNQQSQQKVVSMNNHQEIPKPLNSLPSEEGSVSSGTRVPDRGAEFSLHTVGVVRTPRTVSRMDRIGSSSWHQRR